MKFVVWIVGAAVTVAACSGGQPVGADTSSTAAASVTSTVVTSTSTTQPTTTATLAPVRIAIAGDTGTGTTEQMDVARRMASGESSGDYAALVLLGDLIYPDGNLDLLDEVLLDPYADVLDGDTILVPALGNHDIRQGSEDEILARLGRQSPWYAQRAGSALIVVLDSNVPNDPDQLAWLESTLAASQDRWIIAAMHHPPYSAGYHGSSEEVRERFVPLFKKYGVDLVFAGHDHDYQRSRPIDDITYIVAGGGAKLRPTGTDSFTEVSESALHFVDLEITNDELRATVIGLDGVIDEFTIPYAQSNQP
ncbi:MAG: metallophosphoesterase [Acidimicrobiia bacterium]|nr:MAG: metallophosphoesterase [Acidimicrobiia bacterium]